LEAGASRLQISDADGVFIRGPEGEVAAHFSQQTVASVTKLAVKDEDWFQLVEILGGVGDILVFGQALDGGEKNGVAFRGKGGENARGKLLEAWSDLQFDGWLGS
jgi:hypothetical protein